MLIKSDNRTNVESALRELQGLVTAMDQDKIQQMTSSKTGFSLSAGSRLKKRLFRILSRLLFGEIEERVEVKA